MILYINTANQKLVTVGLKQDEEIRESLCDQNEFGSQVLLLLINKILKNNNLEFKDLKGIEVETGPGSFTGIRVGVSVGNALGFALGIPVNGKKIETDVRYQ